MRHAQALGTAAAILLAAATWISLSARLRALEGRPGPQGPAPEAEPARRPAEAPRTPAAPASPADASPSPPAVLPSPPAPQQDREPLRRAVRDVLAELKAEEDERWAERLRRSGIDVLAKELALNASQVELATPIVEEHLKAIQSAWYPGTVREPDGTERALTWEEKLRLSEEARARVDARIRTVLDGAQAARYDAWVRTWREEAPKKAGEVGPLRWY